MIQTVEAVINERGTVRLLKRIRLPVAHRALVTILEERSASNSVQAAPIEEWNVSRNSIDLLLHEIAAWEAASEEDALKIERTLAETH